MNNESNSEIYKQLPEWYFSQDSCTEAQIDEEVNKLLYKTIKGFCEGESFWDK
jgi:hypothetical protein